MFLSFFVGGSHVLRLHPGQRRGVWSGRAVSHQTGVISTGPSRTHPLSSWIPASCYKWPYPVPAHSTGMQKGCCSVCILQPGTYGQIEMYKYVVDAVRSCKWGKVVTKVRFQSDLTTTQMSINSPHHRSPLMVHLVSMVVNQFGFHSQFTHTAIR